MKFKYTGWFRFLVILGLIALDHLIFLYVFKTSHLLWYLKNGALITAVFTLITFTWDINKVTGLVSANPRHYTGSIQQLLGMQILAFGAFGSFRKGARKITPGLEIVPVIDNLIFLVFAFLLLVLNLLWFVLVAPVQYFFVLFLGGPARVYLSAPEKALAKFEGLRLSHQNIPLEAEVPKEWMDLSLANKSVTLTYALISLVLLGIRSFL